MYILSYQRLRTQVAFHSYLHGNNLFYLSTQVCPSMANHLDEMREHMQLPQNGSISEEQYFLDHLHKY